MSNYCGSKFFTGKFIIPEQKENLNSGNTAGPKSPQLVAKKYILT